MTSISDPPAARRAPAWLWATQRMSPGALLGLVCALAVLMRWVLGTNTDVSWALTMAEKVLDGQRLYRDIVETNPPATALLYVAPVLLARALGIAPELAVDALVLVAAALSLWLASRIIRRAAILDGIDGWLLVACTAAILTVLPMQTFGQREHIAVIALLPYLAVSAVRARRVAPSLGDAIVAGIGAAITIIIKPPFALAVGFAVLASAWCARSWRPLVALENWIAGVMAVAYAAFVIVAFPEFINDMLPVMQAVYLPVRKSLAVLMTRPAVLCWIAMVVLLVRWQGRALPDKPASVVLAASFGFVLAYLVQGKGWPYHTYPMLALGFLALAVAGLARDWPSPVGARDGRTSWLRAFAPALPVAGLALVAVVWLNIADSKDALIEPIRRLKDHPRMLIVTSDLSAGHPLVRQLGGTWVSRVAGLWITAGAFQRIVEEKLDPAEVAALRNLALRDRDMLAEDIAHGRPDIIVVERDIFDWEAWLRADPVLAEQIKTYREGARLRGYVVLQRTGEDSPR